jgi:hypothetical protein
MRPAAVVFVLALAIGVIAPSSTGTAVAATVVGTSSAVPWSAGAEGPAVGLAAQTGTATWQRVPADVAMIGGATPGLALRDLAVATPGLIAVGKDVRGGVVVTSPDGVQWTRSPDNASLDHASLIGVAARPGLIVAAGTIEGSRHGLLWTSADGLAWRAAADVLTGSTGVVDVASGPHAFVVVGAMKLRADASGYRRTVGAAWTSGDGRAWSRVVLPSASFVGDFQPTTVAFLGSRFVALGRASGSGSPAGMLVWTSADGTTWRRGRDFAIPATGAINEMALGPGGRLVAVGSWSSTAPAKAVAFHSLDGLNWARVPDGGAFASAVMRGLACDVDGCVAVGDAPGASPSTGATWTSADGLAWARSGSTTGAAAIGMGRVALTSRGAVALGWAVTPWGASTYVDRAASWVTPSITLPAAVPSPPVPKIGGHWETLPPLAVPRARPVAAAGSDGRVYVFGGATRVTGATRSTETTSVEIFDPGVGRWTFGMSIPGAATARAAAVTSSNGRIYLFNRSGGRVYVYDPAARAWTRGPSVPSGRSVVGASAGPGRLISVVTYLGVTPNWLYTLDPLTGRWRSRGPTSYLAPVAWDAAGIGYVVSTTRALAVESDTARSHPRAPTPIVMGGTQAAQGPRGQVWSVGYAFVNPSGARTSESLTQVVQAYDPATDSWALGPPPPHARGLTAVVGIGDRLYVIGGRPSSTVGSAEVLVVDAIQPAGD